VSSVYVACHFCGDHYGINGRRETFDERARTMRAAGWAIDECRRWKCDRCQKEDAQGGHDELERRKDEG
jgi:hypothetical protein